VVAVAALALAALWLLDRLGPMSSVQRSFTMGPGTTRLTVEVDTGSVRLTPSGGPEIRVQRTVRSRGLDPRIEERTDGSHAVIDASCPGFFVAGCEIRYDIAVPAGQEVELSASTGSLDVRDVEARFLRAAVSTGRTTLVDVDAPLEIRASTGDVTASGLRSRRVTAEVSTGSVDLDFATAPTDVSVTASSGDVRLQLPEAGNPYRVEVDTSSGAEHVDVPTDPRSPRSVAVSVSSGDVVIRPR